jgi:KipI family sensor histidine kinase inhibitor
VHRYGDHALIVDVQSLDHVWALAAALQDDPPDGVIDIVPAARTVTVLFDPAVLPFETTRTWVLGVPAVDAHAHDREPLLVDVVYDGDDLDEVARLLGIDRDDLIRRHAGVQWRVAFAGFAPGFGYLVTDEALPVVPRRPSPRTRVPAGSVALAGEFTGVYPRRGPGGWQLIGRTDAVLWDERRDPPALLTPGRSVRFRSVTALTGGDTLSESTSPSETSRFDAPVLDATSRTATVLRPGLLTLVEDLGRLGMTQYGLALSGALDRTALRLGNRLLGNPEDAAGLEIMAGEAAIRFDQPSWFAVTGARGPLTLSGAPIESDTATQAREGDVLELDRAALGLRYVVTVRGGIHTPRVLGSRSRDVGASIGPSPAAAGDRLPIGPEPGTPIPPIDALTVAPPHDLVLVHAHPGPRIDWFTSDAIARFFDTAWSVTSESNRIGVRLASPDADLTRVATAELPSEAMVAGAVQVPPSGQPTVLLADHPVTGGYPVIAVVADADLDVFAQLRPGQQVRFRHAR